jgi:SH3-like domain-containing protein
MKRVPVVGLLTILALSAVPSPAPAQSSVGPVSGLPLPRFVSLKADKVLIRNGPNKNQDVKWVYQRAGLPVEVTAEFENWRRVRDAEGADGWVYHSLLSGRRTGLVIAKQKDQLIPLRDKPDGNSAVVAQLQPGVLGTVKHCAHHWCRFQGKGFDGYIAQEHLWGVYPNEKVE